MFTIHLLSSALICAVSFFLAFRPNYEDGFFGKLALMALCLGSGVMLLDALGGVDYVIRPTALCIEAGAALFLVRHAGRYLFFCKYWTRLGFTVTPGGKFHLPMDTR
jgi:hypothetical protein